MIIVNIEDVKSRDGLKCSHCPKVAKRDDHVVVIEGTIYCVNCGFVIYEKLETLK